MDKPSHKLNYFLTSNIVLLVVLKNLIAENPALHRKMCNFSSLLNKFQITLPKMWDYPKRVITPLIKDHCVGITDWYLKKSCRSEKNFEFGCHWLCWLEQPVLEIPITHGKHRIYLSTYMNNYMKNKNS